jgi:hypothetical protein
VLSDWQITIPETGTLKAAQPPVVVITVQPDARNSRRRKAALLLSLGGLSRRQARAGDPAAQGAKGGRGRSRAGGVLVQRLRGAEAYKLPGVAETIDWANCLVALNSASALDPETVNNTLGVLLKYRDDLERIAGDEAEPPGRRSQGSAAA